MPTKMQSQLRGYYKYHLSTGAARLMVLSDHFTLGMSHNEIFSGAKRVIGNMISINVPDIYWAYLEASKRDLKNVFRGRVDRRPIIGFAFNLVGPWMEGDFITKKIWRYICSPLWGHHFEVVPNPSIPDVNYRFGWKKLIPMNSEFDWIGENGERIEFKCNFAPWEENHTKIYGFDDYVLSAAKLSQFMNVADMRAWNRDYPLGSPQRDKLIENVEEALSDSARSLHEFLYMKGWGFGYAKEDRRAYFDPKQYRFPAAQIDFIRVTYPDLIACPLEPYFEGKPTFNMVFPDDAVVSIPIEDPSVYVSVIHEMMPEDEEIDELFASMFPKEFLNVDPEKGVTK